jgi:hypothetical protein
VASILDSAFRILRETLTWGIPKPKVTAIGSLPGHAKMLQYQRIEPTATPRPSRWNLREGRSRGGPDEPAVVVTRFLLDDGRVSAKLLEFLKTATPEDVHSQSLRPVAWRTREPSIGGVEAAARSGRSVHSDQSGRPLGQVQAARVNSKKSHPTTEHMVATLWRSRDHRRLGATLGMLRDSHVPLA